MTKKGTKEKVQALKWQPEEAAILENKIVSMCGAVFIPKMCGKWQFGEISWKSRNYAFSFVPLLVRTYMFFKSLMSISFLHILLAYFLLLSFSFDAQMDSFWKWSLGTTICLVAVNPHSLSLSLSRTHTHTHTHTTHHLQLAIHRQAHWKHLLSEDIIL